MSFNALLFCLFTLECVYYLSKRYIILINIYYYNCNWIVLFSIMLIPKHPTWCFVTYRKHVFVQLLLLLLLHNSLLLYYSINVPTRFYYYHLCPILHLCTILHTTFQYSKYSINHSLHSSFSLNSISNPLTLSIHLYIYMNTYVHIL